MSGPPMRLWWRAAYRLSPSPPPRGVAARGPAFAALVMGARRLGGVRAPAHGRAPDSADSADGGGHGHAQGPQRRRGLARRGRGADPADPPSSAAASAFWDDVMRLAHPTEAWTLTPSGRAPPAARAAWDAAAARRLLDETMRDDAFEDAEIVSGIVTQRCCDLYASLPREGQRDMMALLATEYGLDHEALRHEAQQYLARRRCRDRDPLAAPDAGGAGCADGHVAALREAARPEYRRFFRSISVLPGGMRFLLTFRADMLAYLRALQQSPASAEARRRLQAIEAMSEMLRRQIRIWFSMGSVVVKQITWASPACILESIIQHEAIHEIPTWDHLKQRLGPGRLCFAVFHQSMPYEVLTFVEVALQTGVTTNAQLILDDPSPSGVNHATGVSHDTAMFYSITSTQPGLKGIDLGNYLIKWAVKEMSTHLPHLQTFCTLSPLPTFRTWLATVLPTWPWTPAELATWGDTPDALQALLRHADWIADPAIAQRVRPLLMRLAARYLLEAKRPGHPATVYDPVANFHIRNGAMVRQLLWRGDTSQRALSQSFGIMVNYQYTLDAVEANTVAYVRRGAVAVHPRQQDPDLAATVLD